MGSRRNLEKPTSWTWALRYSGVLLDAEVHGLGGANHGDGQQHVVTDLDGAAGAHCAAVGDLGGRGDRDTQGRWGDFSRFFKKSVNTIPNTLYTITMKDTIS